MYAPAATVNDALDGVAGGISHVSVATAFASDGSNEEVGTGTRQPVAWNAAAARNLDTNGTPTMQGLPAATYWWVYYWDALAAGNFKGANLIGGEDPLFANVGTTDVFTVPNHSFVDNDRVAVLGLNGAAVPAGLTEGQIYHVVNAAAGTFELSATQGGAAIDVTAAGQCMVQKTTGGLVLASQSNAVLNDADIGL